MIFDKQNIKMFNTHCLPEMKKMGDKVFDLAIVDPPYFSGPDRLGYFGEKLSPVGVFRGGYWKGNKFENWKVPTQEYFDELFRVSKNQIIWGINYFNIQNPGPGRIIWDKCNLSSTFSDCEIAYTSLHDSVRIFPYMWNGMNQGKSITEGRIMQGNKKLNEKRIHPTQKPVNLYRWLLQKYAKPGDLILDTHHGSGSLAIACLDFGYNLTAYEIEKIHFEDAVSRVENYIKQLKLFK